MKTPSTYPPCPPEDYSEDAVGDPDPEVTPDSLVSDEVVVAGSHTVSTGPLQLIKLRVKMELPLLKSLKRSRRTMRLMRRLDSGDLRV